jgi:hypothetical protein
VRVRFLVDENVTPRLKAALLRRDAAIDILRVGDADAPAFGTLDPDVLRYSERHQRMLITGNRVSMPEHVTAHLATGGHHWGIMRLRPGAPFRDIIEDLYLVWEVTDAEEWLDHLRWIPM